MFSYCWSMKQNKLLGKRKSGRILCELSCLSAKIPVESWHFTKDVNSHKVKISAFSSGPLVRETSRGPLEKLIFKIAGKNINNLRYADDSTLMAESEEEPKILLMKVKEESEKVA